MDFVDEWLTSGWEAASQWIERSRDSRAFRQSHDKGPADFEDTGKRCRSDTNLWQVALADGRYFEVRWTTPYVFRLVAVSNHSFAGCDIADQAADEPDVSLFPDTQWHPAN